MPFISDYHVISDKSVSLKIGGDIDKDFPFSLPSAGFLPNERGVLLFRVDGVSAENLRFRVNFNGEQKLRTTLNGSDLLMSLHEVVDGMKLDNKLTFTLESGTGTLKISDIVLYFQRNVA